MGYEGMINALAVEFDTYMNYDQMDFYENHVSVLTQGWRYNLVANHSRSLASTTRVPDLTRGKHTVRIRYDPNFDEKAVPHPSFKVDGYGSWFIEVSTVCNKNDVAVTIHSIVAILQRGLLADGIAKMYCLQISRVALCCLQYAEC
jgi:hypothetical protein